MKNTLSWSLAAVAVGAVAGVALGYWEARPWAANAMVAASDHDPADHDHAGHDHGEEAKDAPGEPRLVVPETTYHFGNMEVGTKQKHGFEVRNDGGSDLSVKFEAHTCKCTGVWFNGKELTEGDHFVIPAHAKSVIELQWNAVQVGPFRHGATFSMTNDPALSRVELTVEGEIVGSTTLEPALLGFGTVHVGQPARAELIVMAFLEPKVEILSHEVVGEGLAERVKVSFEPVPKEQLPNPQAKAGVKVIAEYDPEGTIGPLAGSLRLVTSIKKTKDVDKQEETLEVPIYGVVKGDVSIFSPAWTEANGLLRMGAVRSAEGGVSKLFVNIRGDHAADTKLSVEKVAPPELKVTIGEPQALRAGLVRVPLEVAIAPGTRPMVRAGENDGGEGEIVLATTHPDTPKVRLRVTFTVQP